MSIPTAYLEHRATAGHPDPAEVITVTFGGKTFRCGRRTYAHLLWTQERLDELHPGCRIVVLQSCYHTGYEPSAGTHDADGVLDLAVEGDMGATTTEGHWLLAQGFLRAHGWPGWWRHTGEWAEEDDWHLHVISDQCPGPVGGYVPAQVDDYYRHALGLKGQHDSGDDPTWHPADPAAQVFDYPGWLARQAAADPPKKTSPKKAPAKKTAAGPGKGRKGGKS